MSMQEGIIKAGEPPHVHHMDPPTAYQAAKLGMWLFLATEVLLFGGLFTGFALYRWMYLEAFHHGSRELSWKWGGFNTAVLIVSSFFAALAVDAAQHGDNKKTLRNLGVTIICGFIFLVVKYIEYSGKLHHGLLTIDLGGAGVKFNTPEIASQYKTFFGFYFCMTGLHALHVIAGMGILAWVASLAAKNRFSPVYYTPVEVGALYWHLVDLIWIYLFPLLYLVG